MHPQNRGLIGNIAAQPIAFAAAFLGCFLLSVLFLGYVDALPEPSKTATSTPIVRADTVAAVTKTEDPVRITVSSIGLNASIKNPASTKVAVLDEALLTGAVRYPTSAMLGEKGTVLLFGHSSYLPVVHNQAYKAFDEIQKLTKGEVISVYSATLEYRYAVESVTVANADEDVIELRQDGQYLTLVTCDSFTTKSSRFVVTAKFVGAYPLTSH